MEKLLENMLPILGVEHDLILSKNGDITAAFEVQLPELFSLDSQDMELLHQTFIRALKILPPETIFLKQDWFTETRFEGQLSKEHTFMSHSSERFFNERPYLDHRCFIFITQKPQGRKPGSSLFSNLLRSSLVPEQTISKSLLQGFKDAIGQFERIVKDSGLVSVNQLTEQEIYSTSAQAGLLEQYLSLATPGKPPVIRDIELKGELRIGEYFCQLYTLADVADLPAMCGPRINYDRFSTDKTKFSVGFASSLGLLLPCNHLYSQYIFVGDAHKAIQKLERKRLRLQSLSAYSRENAIARDATNEFLNEAISTQRMPVRAHFNLLAWTDQREKQKELKNLVSSALSSIEATAKQETAGAAQIFWAGIPGNAADFPMNDTFDTFVEQASCFLNLETNYRSSVSPFGIRLVDRLSGIPLHVDLSDEPMNRGLISNRNKGVFGGSGSGKSMFMNHLMRCYYEQGAHCIIVDVGHSYTGLCELVGGYYFTYEEKNPIRFNPFFLSSGDQLDTEKKESIKTLLVALWKRDDESYRRSEYVALSNALHLYYEYLDQQPSVFPCFNSFYEFLRDQYIETLRKDRVKEKEFDIDNFLYVLRPYYSGGEFDYLLNATEKLDIFHQRFIVFELDNVKDHQILFPVITLVIMELFVSKMRKLKGVRKVITIEEAWKAIAKAGMAEFLKYLYKTVRKHFGEAIVVSQELDDVISSPIVKEAILNNADCKILLDMRKFQNKFDQLQAVMGLPDKGKTQVLSLNKSNDPKRKYRELYVDFLNKVYGFEPSPEEYWAYTTEQTEKIKVQAYAKRYGSMKKGIQMLVKDLKMQ